MADLSQATRLVNCLSLPDVTGLHDWYEELTA
jgi:hypothetical protein